MPVRDGEGPESLGSHHSDAGLIPSEGREEERKRVTEASELSHAIQQGPQGVREPKSPGRGSSCLLGMGLLSIPSASATGWEQPEGSVAPAETVMDFRAR